jgi:hypothetical protein
MYESQQHINTSKNMARYRLVGLHRRLQLVTVYRYTPESRQSHPPPLKPTIVFSLNEGGDDKITLLDVFKLMEHIKRGEFLFVHKARSDR